MESHGKIGSRDSEEWRRRIVGWARFNESATVVA
jgi:hypothetical protein